MKLILSPLILILDLESFLKDGIIKRYDWLNIENETKVLNDKVVTNLGQKIIYWPVIFSFPTSDNTSGSVCLSEAEWEETQPTKSKVTSRS